MPAPDAPVATHSLAILGTVEEVEFPTDEETDPTVLYVFDTGATLCLPLTMLSQFTFELSEEAEEALTRHPEVRMTRE